MAEKRSAARSAEKKFFEPPDGVKMRAYIKKMEEYRELYQKSINDPAKFWEGLAEQLDWYKKWDKVLEFDFSKPEIQ